MKPTSPIVLCLATLLLGCESRAPGSTTSSRGEPSSGGASVERPAGPQTLRKGDSHRVEINAGQSHEWGLQLAAGERVTLTMEAASTGGTMCQGWQWGFYNPSGGALREQIMGPEESGRWSMTLEQLAEASIVEGPTAGRYQVRVAAPADCAQLRYTLGAR